MTLTAYRRLWRRACAESARSGYPRRAHFYRLALKARRAHGQRWLIISSQQLAFNDLYPLRKEPPCPTS